ncbi:AglZ/HisF2 family acetamidino modification protein [Paremcibacter congregatus]|uniref:AglZ/HisF2 family acetamidino modification protein n=1 Tax=Paremcibacter congregatus TaxID=2043170 RepID=UPI003A95C64C
MLPRIIPCLQLEGASLVKTVKFKKPTYIGDPINAVRIFNEKEVDELVLIDIRASKRGTEIQYELIEHIASECFMPLAYGGGIKTIDDVQRIINLGVEKVIINTAGLDGGNLFKQATEKLGSQSVIASLDVKKNLFGQYSVYTKSGSKKVNRTIEDVVKYIIDSGVGEIVVNSINHDGMMQGYDLEITNRVASQINIPVMACGGAGKLDDIVRVVKEAGVSSAAAGSLFIYQGKHKAVLINYPKYERIKELFSYNKGA